MEKYATLGCPAIRSTIRRHLAWLTPLVVVLEFFIAAAGVSRNLEYSDSMAYYQSDAPTINHFYEKLLKQRPDAPFE